MKKLINDARAWVAVKVYPNIDQLYRQGLLNGYGTGRFDERTYVIGVLGDVIASPDTKKSYLPGLKMLAEVLTPKDKDAE